MQDRTDHSINQSFSFTATFKFAKFAPAEKTLEAPAPSQHLSQQLLLGVVETATVHKTLHVLGPDGRDNDDAGLSG